MCDSWVYGSSTIRNSLFINRPRKVIKKIPPDKESALQCLPRSSASDFFGLHIFPNKF